MLGLFYLLVTMVPLTPSALFTLLSLDCSQEEGYCHEKGDDHQGEACGQEGHCHEKGNDHQETCGQEGSCPQKGNSHQEEGRYQEAVSLGRLVMCGFILRVVQHLSGV
jgi:hypothetical protein